jgi:hypothetical protein
MKKVGSFIIGVLVGYISVFLIALIIVLSTGMLKFS